MKPTLPADTRMGLVSLSVGDLARSLNYSSVISACSSSSEKTAQPH